jgi:hypothetical protein
MTGSVTKAEHKGRRRKRSGAGSVDTRPRLSAHPRARRQIRETKAYAGLAAFALVLLLSLQGGALLLDAGVRALGAGCGAYVVAWAIAVFVWRQLARAEVALAEQRYLEQLES